MSRKKPHRSVNAIQQSNLIRPEPRNPRQAAYLQALADHDQTFVFGPAGTGKTFLATVFAARQFLLGEIDAIRMTRPKVEVEEQWGFLPGTIERKTAPWTWPIVEILEECLGKQQVIELQKSGQIAVEPFAFMRGRTFRRSFVLLDEAQNATPAQMKMFLTRIGEDSKVVINGDIRQCDIRGGSGLGMAVRMVREHGIPAGMVEFGTEDVERSALCRMWVEAFESEETDGDDYAAVRKLVA